MNASQMKDKIDRIMLAADELLPKFLETPADMNMNNGNVAMCIISEDGEIYGKMWGDDKIRKRDVFVTAWRKCNQVWITGIASGKYEELVYTKKIDPEKFGIRKPDFIGWEGGLPIVFDGGVQLAMGVSGMTSEADLELIVQSAAAVGGAVKK